MIHCYDRASWDAALALPLDAELRVLLAARHRHIGAEGLLDLTDLVVITADTNDADLVSAIGWTPRVDPDGRRAGEPGFVTPFDYAYRASGDFYVAVQIVGNAGHAFELVVAEDADPAIVALCREQAE